MKILQKKLSNLKKKHFIGLGSAILFIGISWVYITSYYSSRSIASDENCNEIEIFKRHLEGLSACEFGKKIEEKLSLLSDIKIIDFRYRVLAGFFKQMAHPILRSNTLGRFNLAANKDGIEIILACHAHLYKSKVRINIECENVNFRTTSITLNFDSITDKRNDSREVLR